MLDLINLVKMFLQTAHFAKHLSAWNSAKRSLYWRVLGSTKYVV